MKTTDKMTAEILIAEQRREALEAQIGELKTQLEPLHTQPVSQAVYAGAVVAQLEGQIRKFQEAAGKAARGCSVAGAFAEVDFIGEAYPGGVKFSQSQVRKPDLLERALEESKVLPHVALLAILGPQALESVKAWATQHAAAAGCPEQATDPADVAETAAELRGQLQACMDEVRGLNAQLSRLYARQQEARVKANGGHVQRGSVLIDGNSANAA